MANAYGAFPQVRMFPEFSPYSVRPLTDWYPADTTPARPGVYQRSRVLPDGSRAAPMFAAWENGRWYMGAETPDFAAAKFARHDVSIWPNGLEWRRLAGEP